MRVTKNLAEARQLLVEALRRRGVKVYGATTNKYEVLAWTHETEFDLSFMPGNRRTVISHAVKVFPQYWGKGIGTKMCKLREEAAIEAGVTLMLATVMNSNAAEIRVLEKCGWQRFTNNERTGCSLWGKQL